MISSVVFYHSPPSLLRWNPLLTLKLTVLIRRANQYSPGIPPVSIAISIPTPGAGITDECCQAQLDMGYVGSELWLLCWSSKQFTHLSKLGRDFDAVWVLIHDPLHSMTQRCSRKGTTHRGLVEVVQLTGPGEVRERNWEFSHKEQEARKNRSSVKVGPS